MLFDYEEGGDGGVIYGTLTFPFGLFYVGNGLLFHIVFGVLWVRFAYLLGFIGGGGGCREG